MKKSLHSSLRSSPNPLAFLGAVPTLTHSTRTGPSPSQGQQLLLTMAKVQCSPPQNTLAQEQCHGLQAKQLRYSHGLPGPTKRLPVPGYNYKDRNNSPGQPNQTRPQKALPVPKPSKLQWCRGTSRVDEFFLERDGSRAGDRQEHSAPAPGARLFPALTWEYVTYFWKKNTK